MKKYPMPLFYVSIVLSVLITGGTLWFFYIMIPKIFGGDPSGALAIIIPSGVLILQSLISGNRISYYKNFAPENFNPERYQGITIGKAVFKSFLIIFLSVVLLTYGFLLFMLDYIAWGLGMMIAGFICSFFLQKELEYAVLKSSGDI